MHILKSVYLKVELNSAKDLLPMQFSPLHNHKNMALELEFRLLVEIVHTSWV